MLVRLFRLLLVLLVVSGAGCAGTASARGTKARTPVEAEPSAGPPPHEPSEEHDGEAGGELPPLPPADEPSAPFTTPATSGAGSPAARYAVLDRTACESELGRRNIGFDRVDEARGVIEPLRLKGAIAGVEFHSMLPAAQRKTSPYEIYDCRLVLALDDWAHVLAKHDVVEVIHFSVYRPSPAKQVLTGAGKRHGAGLAIDAAIFKTRDGKTMTVEKDFHGRIGGKPCGGSLKGLPPETVFLREIVCEAADKQLFNVLLTPDFNWPHRNHFHLEVSPSARWVYLR